MRPGYPDEAVEYLRSALALEAGRVVADLAAGTGKLSRRLLESGARVLAVEPLAEMRAILAERVPAAEPIAATAEETTLPTASIDAATVGQAFHWFRAEEALAEIARILRPEGKLGLVWNVRELDDPLQLRLEELLDARRGGAPSGQERPWRETLRRSPLFGAEERRSFPWEQPYVASQLAERIASVSFVAALGGAEREELLAEVRGLVADLPEPFPFRYRTDVYVYPRLGRRRSSLRQRAHS